MKYSLLKLLFKSSIILILILFSILWSQDVQYYLERAEQHLKENRLNLAMGEYLKIIAREPDNITAHEKLAELYIKMEYFESAIDEYNLILTLSDNPSIRFRTNVNLANIYSKLNQPDESIKYYKEALNIDPKKYEVRYKIGRHYMKQGNYGTAYDHFHEIRRYYRRNVDFLIDYGLSAYRLNDFEQAKSIFKRAYNINKNKPDISKKLGIIKYYEKNYLNSAIYLRHYVSLVDDDVETLKILGEVYQHNNDNEYSYETYKRLVELEPENWEFHYLSGKFAEKLEKTEKAENHYLTSLSLNNRNEETYKKLYQHYINREKYEKAEDIIIAYSNQYPTNLNILVTLAKVKEMKNDFTSSVATYKDILQKNRNFRPALEGLAQLRLQIAENLEKDNRFQMAIEEYKKIIELTPNYFIAYYKLGNLYHKINNNQLALFFLEKGLEIQKEHYELNRLLGIIYYNFNNNTKAVQLLLKCIEHEENDIEVLRILSDIFFKEKDYKKAINIYEKIVKLDPQARDFYNLGILYEAINNFNSAISYYETALKLNPDWKTLYFKLGELNFKINKLNESLKYYTSAKNYFPEDGELFYKKGKINFITRRYESSLENLNTALKYNYKNKMVYFLIGTIHNKRSDYLKSIKSYEVIFPDNKNLEFNNYNIKKLLFDSYMKYSASIMDSDDKTAEKYLLKAIEIDNTNIEVYGMLSIIETNRKNYNKSLGYLWIAETIARDNNDINLMLAKVHFGRKSYREAVEYYETYIANNPRAVNVFDIQFNLAYSYSKIGNSEKAIDTYRKVFRIRESEEARINITKEYIKTENYRNAIWHLDRLFEHNASNTEGLQLRMDIAITTNDHNNIIVYNNKLKNHNISKIHYNFYEGISYYYTNNHSKTIEIFNNMLDYEEKLNDINYYLGNSYYKIKDYKNAVAFLEKSRDYKTSEVLPVLKNSFVKLARTENRLDNLLQAYRIDENDIELLYDIANEYLKISDFQNSKDFFVMIADKQDNYKDVSKKLANIYEKNNNYEEAIKFYKLYNLVQKEAEIKNKIAVLSATVEDYDEAIKFYIRTFNISRDINLLLEIADLYIIRNKYDDAIKHLENYVNINNRDQNNIFKLAKLLYNNNYFLRAETHFTHLVRLDNTNQEYYYYLAKTYLQRNKYNESYKAFMNSPDFFEKEEKIYDYLTEIILALEKYNNVTEKIFLSGLNYFSDNKLINYTLAVIQYEIQKYEHARDNFEVAGLSFRNTADYLYNIYSLLSNRALEKNNYNESIDYANKVLNIKEKDVNAMLNIAFSSYHLKQYENSLNYLSEINKIEKKRNDVLMLKGNIHYLNNDYTNAKKMYSLLPAETLNQKQLTEYIHSLTELQKYNRALEIISLLEIDNYEKSVLANKVFTYFNDKNNQIETLLVKKNFTTSKELAEIKYELSKLYFETENWNETIKTGLEIIDSEYISVRQKRIISYFTGKSYLKLNNQKEAIKYYASALPPAEEYATNIHLDYANLLKNANELVLAVEHYEKYYKLEESRNIRETIASLSEKIADDFFRKMHYVKAEEYYKKSENYGKSNNNITYKLARININNNNYNTAINLLKNIHTDEKTYLDAEYYLYVSYNSVGNVNSAIKHFENYANRINEKNTYYELAEFLREIKESEKSIKYYTEYLKFEENLGVRKKLGYLYKDIKNNKSAYDNLTMYYRENKSDLDVKFDRIQLLISLNRIEEAATESKEYAEKKPGDPVIYTLISQMETAKKNYDAAISALKTAVKNGYESEDIPLRFAKLYYLNDNFTNSLEKLNIYYNKHNSYPEGIYHYYHGDIKFSMQNFKLALDHFNQVTQIKFDINYKRGYSYYMTNDNQNAIKHFDKVSSSSSYYLESITHISDIYEKEKDFNNAYKYTSIISRIRPEKNNIKRNARLNFQMNNYTKSEEYYLKAFSIETDYSIYKNLGEIYYLMNNYDSSIHYYSEYYQRNRDAYEILDTIGSIYLLSSDTISAIRTYQESVIVNPAGYNNYKILAELWNDVGNPVQVIHNYRKFLEHDTSDKEIYRTIANEYIKIGRFERAIEYYLEYKKYESFNATDYYNLAFSYRNTGDLDNATIYLNECLKLDADYGKANNLFVAIHYEKGKEYFYKNLIDEALNKFSQAEKIEYNYEFTNLYFTEIFIKKNEYNEAKKYLDDFLNKEITNIKALNLAYEIYTKLNLKKELARIFERALTVGETIENIRILASEFYYKIKKDYSETINMLEKVNQNLIVNDEELLSIMANSYFKVKNYENARKYFILLNELYEGKNLNVIFSLANSYFYLNDYNNAKKLYQNLINLNYYNIEVYEKLGNIKFSAGNYNEAISLYNNYFKSNRNNYNVNYNLAFSYFRLNDYHNSAKHFELATQLTDEENHTLYYLYGLAEFHIRNFDNALEKLLTAEKYGRNNLWSNFYIGRIYFTHKQNYEKTYQYFRNALKFSMENNLKINILQDLVISGYKIEKYNETLKYSDELLSISSDNWIGLFYKSKSYYELNDFKNSKTAYDAIRGRENQFDYNLFGGMLYNQLQEYNNAIRFLSNALKIKSNNISALNEIGKSYYYLNNNTQALKFLENSLKLERNYTALKYSGLVKKDIEERYFEALDFLNEAREIKNTDEIIYFIAETYYKSERLRDSIELLRNRLNDNIADNELKQNFYILKIKQLIILGFYEDILTIYNRIDVPLNEDLDYYLALTYFYLRNYEKSREVLYTHIQKTNKADMLNLYALVQFNLLNYEESIYYLKKAIDLSKDLRYYFNLSRIYHQMNDVPNAVEAYKNVLQINQNNFDAHYNLGKLLLNKNPDDGAQHLRKALSLTDNPEKITEIRYLLQNM